MEEHLKHALLIALATCLIGSWYCNQARPLPNWMDTPTTPHVLLPVQGNYLPILDLSTGDTSYQTVTPQWLESCQVYDRLTWAFVLLAAGLTVLLIQPRREP